MRSESDIYMDIQRATLVSDAEALERCADELDSYDSPKAKAQAEGARGVACFLKGDFSRALEYFHRTIARNENNHDDNHVAWIEINIGNVYHSTGDYLSAHVHYNRALSGFQASGDRRGEATVLGNIGNVYTNMDDYPTALEYYHRALDIIEPLGNDALLANTLANLGTTYAICHDYTTSTAYFNRAIALCRTFGDRPGEAHGMSNVGLTYAEQGNYTLALECYNNALMIYDELCFRRDSARVRINIVETYLKMGLDDVAQAEMPRIDNLLSSQSVEPGARSTHAINRATLQERTYDVDGAITTLRLALEEAQTLGMRSHATTLHKALREIALRQNNLAEYVHHNNEFTRITEEIRGKDTAAKMAIQAKQREIDAERQQIEKQLAVLYSALPKHIAERVASGEQVNDHYDNAAVMFLDIVGFTSNTSHMPPTDVVKMLESIFSTIDSICDKHSVTKIKTIGDSYMCFATEGNRELDIGNSSEQRAASPEQRVAAVALAVQQTEFYWPGEASPEGSLERLRFRIGIHRGPATAGVIGTQRLQYDVWGDTVNVASRMESTGEPGRIQVSSAFAEQLRLAVAEKEGTANSNSQQQQKLTERGEVNIKGKGTMTTYWLEPSE